MPLSKVVQDSLNGGVAGTGPAFSAYANAVTTFSSNTTTKVLFQAEEFDTNNNFASSRFTPTVAGYYEINSSVQTDASNWFELFLFKNGSNYKTLFYSWSSSVQRANGSALVYMNGSTDYVEIYLRHGSASQTAAAASTATWFDGVLVRAV